MKKKKTIIYISLFILFTTFFINIEPASATKTGRISSTTGVVLRKNAGTTYDKITTVPHNAIVTINSTKKTADGSTGCSTGIWTNITYNGSTGYACSKYVEEQTTTTTVPSSDMAKMTDSQFDDYLDEQGFPSSYKTKLKSLHKSHPNWVFVSVQTKDNWATTLKNEMYPTRSLYQSLRDGSKAFLSTADGDYNWYTDKFTVYDGSTWYQANEATVAYFMDPRNFLVEDRVFMFEDVLYYPSYQTETAVKGVLTSSFMQQYVPYFMSAAKLYNVSPVYLASLARQEVGLSSSTATDGKYNGAYNFFNIQATAGSDAVYKGLKYAKEQGWTTPQKAIEGGAKWIVNGYINAGQHSLYLQKWNVKKNGNSKGYGHQYQQNIEAPYSQAKTTKTSYQSMGMLDYPFVFTIPVYSGIPSSTSLPKEGNPNNYLKTLTVDGKSVTNFDGANTSYKVTVAYNATSAKIAGTTVNKNATISGAGTIKLSSNTTTANVKVTAQNGNVKTYKITINKAAAPATSTGSSNDNTSAPTIAKTITSAGYKSDNNYIWNLTLGSGVSTMIDKLEKANPQASINIHDKNNKAKTSGTLVTGDKLIIKSGNESKILSIVIYGDENGDGKISIVDLGKVQKHLLNQSKLSGAYSEAADVDKNGKINIIDLGKIQKHLLKTSNISQS